MLQTTVSQIAGLVISSAFTATLTYSITTRNLNKCYRDAMYSLIKSQITSEWRRLMKQGFTYLHDMETIQDLFKQYVALGGNGSVRLLILDIEKLRRVSINDR